ncbi:HlyD family efflux transporter periplasmic adaptor subunit [Chryseobacterium sp. SG20098]|uniref:HlyD family secretion protein n=1 Tax=Chryseobacterium sp. SG20098 TaxID=3074145 RepID=UPI002882FC36|nr:HlyD family efflux transporter periplasmic adaptor subunit [Chryseobacterium sp. SG20098]WNI37308.1 HlyD family efflux transporter periplasmic adaptor subunit [Chryseobacterium sp. SG20098]
MDEINDGLKIYSEEVRDILTDPPKTILKWGNTILLSFISILLLISWFVKYPDIITSQIIITTETPPQKLVAKNSGKIDAILVRDKETISKNTPLAVLENSANYKDVFLLKSIVDTINLDKSNFPFEKLKSSQLGDVESTFSSFQKEYIANQLNINFTPYKVENNAQSYEAIQLKERLSLLESQKSINESELKLKHNDLTRSELLYKEGVISTQEIEKQRVLFLQDQKNYKNVLSNISQLRSSINELNKNNKVTIINESKEYINLERNVLQSFYQLKKSIKDWELSYVLRSSINGRVNFLQLWSVNQSINTGDNVFSIIPMGGNQYIGKVKAPAQNFGKVKVGQTVNIKLANYPDQEFGILEGVINNISLTPDKDGNLLLDVTLPKGLQTTYKKRIAFQQEMNGRADIVTDDLRLLERLLYQFKDLFAR